MINVNLDMKRLLKLLTKEFPTEYIVVEQQIRANSTEPIHFRAYVANHEIFTRSDKYMSTWSRDFTTVKELTAHVKESIHNYRISEAQITEVEFEDNVEPINTTEL